MSATVKLYCGDGLAVGQLAYKSLSGETINYGSITISGVLAPIPLKKAYY